MQFINDRTFVDNLNTHNRYMRKKSNAINPERLKVDRHRVSLAMSRFTLPLLRAIYSKFQGDLVMAMVLGEIATHNVGAWLSSKSNDPHVLDDVQSHGRVLRPCNALSIADATDIPRETVRRKVDSLIERGWIYRSESGHLFVHPSVADNFDHMTTEMVDSLLSCADHIKELIVDDSQ